MAAEMTGKPVIRTMQCQGETAIRATADMATLVAEHRGRVTTPVQEKNGLLAGLESFGYRHL
jgi:hypothetical protein